MTYVFVKNDTILKCSLGGVSEMTDTHTQTDRGVTAINNIDPVGPSIIVNLCYVFDPCNLDI